MFVKSKLWSCQTEWQFLLHLIIQYPRNFLFIILTTSSECLSSSCSASASSCVEPAQNTGETNSKIGPSGKTLSREILRDLFIFLFYRPGPWVESTKGEIWPKPKVQKSQPEFFSVRSSSLKFEVRKKVKIYSHSCKIFHKIEMSALYTQNKSKPWKWSWAM